MRSAALLELFGPAATVAPCPPALNLRLTERELLLTAVAKADASQLKQHR